MFSLLRTPIIVFLVLLQLFAPLVHAHTGEQIFTTGLHVPGLEAYVDAPSAKQTTAILRAASQQTDAEGILVDINTGLKAKHSKALDNTDTPLYITPDAVAITATLSEYDCNFSPQPQQTIAQLFAIAHSARAPPQHFPA